MYYGPYHTKVMNLRKLWILKNFLINKFLWNLKHDFF